jgi:hypothetical protein
VIAFAVATVYFAVIGAAVQRLVTTRPSGRCVAAAEALLHGIGITGLLGVVAGVLNVPLARPFFVCIWFAAVLVLLLRKRNRASTADVTATTPLTWFFIVLAAVPVIVATVDSMCTPLTDYDGRVTWMLKARAIAAEESISGRFFRGRTARNAHSQYPLLLPIADAALLKLGGTLDDHAARPLYPLAAAALLMMLYGAASELTEPVIAATIVAGVAWLPQLATESDGGVSSAYSDVPLAAFVALALYSIVTGRATENRAAFGVQLSFLILTKNEGLAFAIVLLAAAALWNRGTAWKRLVVSVIVAVGAIALLTIWRAGVPLEFDENYPKLLERIIQNAGRYPEAAGALLSRMGEVRKWGLFWIITIAAAVVALLSRAHRRHAVTMAGCAVAVLLLDVTAYAVTSWNIAELATSSADRLLSQIVPMCAVLIAMGAEALRNRAA